MWRAGVPARELAHPLLSAALPAHRGPRGGKRTMKRSGWVMACVGVLVATPALAHELECIKEVNGETYLEVSQFPATLNYRLVVKNIHPSLPSDVLEAKDPLLDRFGFEGFDTPFTLALGASQEKTFSVKLDDLADCQATAAL